MKRFILSVLLFAAAVPAHAAGVFNGATSDLSVVESAAAPIYPVLVACWFKPANATTSGTLVAISDDGAGGSLDALVLQSRGDVAGDPVRVEATAAGSASQSSTAASFTANAWYLAVGYFESNASRQAVLSGSTLTHQITWSTAETTTRAVGDLTHVSIGSLHNGGATNHFSGKIAACAIWQNVDDVLVDLAARQLASGLRPNDTRHVLRSSLAYYQGLASGRKPVETGEIAVVPDTGEPIDIEIDNSEHIFEVDDVVDVGRTGFRRQNMTISAVDGAVVTVTGGTGPDFTPAETDVEVVVMPATPDPDINGGPVVGSSMTASNLTFDTDSPPQLGVAWSGVEKFRWPTTGANAGPLPYARLVGLDSGYLALIDADDTNAIGAIRGPIDYRNYGFGSQAVKTFASGRLRLEVAEGDTIAPGDQVYQGVDGTVASSGTIRVGVSIDSQTRSAGEIVTVGPGWTQ